MTQQEYIRQLEELHSSLERAWDGGERVLSIKLAIKSCKLLQETTVGKFYPSLFVLVAEVLDSFGDRVFNRILAKAEEGYVGSSARGKSKRKPRLPRNWTEDDISVEAKETCRNWFYKISSIRELLPRIYMECCLLKSLRFLCPQDMKKVVARLSDMCRGIGDPLERVYAQFYISRCASIVGVPSNASAMVMDYAFGTGEYWGDGMKERLRSMDVDIEEYCHLQSPAVGWIAADAGRSSDKSLFTALLKRYRDYGGGNLMLLWHILDKFPPVHYSHNAAAMIELIKMSKPGKEISVMDVLETIGGKFLESPPPEEQRLTVLNEVWRVVTKCSELPKYISCCTAWLEVVLAHYSSMELDVLLRDIVKHLGVEADDLGESGGGDDAACVFLEPLLKVLTQHCYDFDGFILRSGELLQILDRFKEGRKAEHCKEILDSFRVRGGETGDPVLIHTLFEVSRTLHDCIDSLTPEGERRHCAFLICAFIERVNYGRDFERQLSTLADCRAAFYNLDDVKVKLVLCVCKLSMRTLAMSRGSHSKKTSAFVRGCLAFIHVTIPSIRSVLTRLHLLVNCGWVGLKNQCLPQTDAFLKQAITLVPEFDGRSEDLASWAGSFCGLLVMVPGCPSLGPFYLGKALKNALSAWRSRQASQSRVGVGRAAACEARCLVSLLGCCAGWGQDSLPYGVAGVDGNDVLYGGTSDYAEELKSLSEDVFKAVVEGAESLGDGEVKDELLVVISDVLLCYFSKCNLRDKMIKNILKKVGRRNDCEIQTINDKHDKWKGKILIAANRDDSNV